MIEEFFDLRISDRPAPDADLVRIENPDPDPVAELTRQGWFYKPSWVTYALRVPRSMDEHLASFAPKHRRNVRRLLRGVPYRLSSELDFRGFRELYLRTVVNRPRGKDRLAEVEDWDGWSGLHLYDGDRMVAGILFEGSSIGFGAFERTGFDLEHYLILQVLARAIDERSEFLTLGVDTNRYGHHLSLGIAPYKLRIGFTPLPYEFGGRELLRIQSFARFEEGLFFYAYGPRGFTGHLFARDAATLERFRHRTAPPIELHRI